jgi:HD-like signal output (HDOD) protein/CheY-like chemotaxis protein
MLKKIYIVDDEPDVRELLRDLLRGLDPSWQVTDFSTPAQTLAAVENSPPDLVLADQKMPGMTGSQMLELIRQTAPQTVRIIVSAQAGSVEKICAAHQYLCKPFDIGDLGQRVRQALAARASLQNPDLARLVMSLNSFPALPGVYLELVRELEKEDSSLERAAELINKDGSVLTRMLQLANSPLFRGTSVITDSLGALLQLGTSNVKALMLSLHVFQSYHPLHFLEMPVDVLWNHSCQTARLAQEFCLKKLDKDAADDAFFAGLVHDLGCLILMENGAERYRGVCTLATQEKKPLFEAEQQVFQVTHLEISSFMLRLWGMPETVTEAVTFSSAPWNGPSPHRFNPAVALYMADTLSRQQQPPDRFVTPPLNLDYLDSVEALDLLEASA